MATAAFSIRLRVALHRLRKSASGVAAMEFALVAPVMILLYVASFQFADAISAYRKVTITARTLADLTSQYTSVSSSITDTILEASSQVMAPYKPSAGQFTISQVVTDNAGHSKIDWSRKFNGQTASPGHAINTAVTLPTDVAVPNTSIVMAEITYQYQPLVAPGMLRPIHLSDRIYMFPRRSDSIPMN